MVFPCCNIYLGLVIFNQTTVRNGSAGPRGRSSVGNNLKDLLVWFSYLLSLPLEEFVALNLAEYVAPLFSYKKDSKPQER